MTAPSEPDAIRLPIAHTVTAVAWTPSGIELLSARRAEWPNPQDPDGYFLEMQHSFVSRIGSAIERGIHWKLREALGLGENGRVVYENVSVFRGSLIATGVLILVGLKVSFDIVESISKLPAIRRDLEQFGTELSSEIGDALQSYTIEDLKLPRPAKPLFRVTSQLDASAITLLPRSLVPSDGALPVAIRLTPEHVILRNFGTSLIGPAIVSIEVPGQRDLYYGFGADLDVSQGVGIPYGSFCTRSQRELEKPRPGDILGVGIMTPTQRLIVRLSVPFHAPQAV